MLQFIFNGPQLLFAIDGCELTGAKCRETILGFGPPSPVNGILFNRVKAAPKGVNNLRPLQWRELQSFVRQNRAIHAVTLNLRPRNASLVLKLDWSFAFRAGELPATTSAVSWLYQGIIRPVLFTQNAEKIHDRTLRALGCVCRSALLHRLVQWLYGAPELPVELFGLKFPNPVGLAAGMDKFGQAVPAWSALGFGFTELGGVTRQAQPGNPAPRLFRAIKDQAIVNSMGFNNPGAAALAGTLAEWKRCGRWPGHPVGINLGKSKSTPLDKADEDYAESFRFLRPYVDFFVVNVSSPNTPNLRQLQGKAALDEILAALPADQPRPGSRAYSRQGRPRISRSRRWMKFWSWRSRAGWPELSPPTPPSPARPRPITPCGAFMSGPAV